MQLSALLWNGGFFFFLRTAEASQPKVWDPDEAPERGPSERLKQIEAALAKQI